MLKKRNKKGYFVFLVVTLLILGVGFSGCIDIGDDENDEEVEGTLWSAFEFDKEVEENDEDIGRLKEFTYEQTYIEEDIERSFEIHTTYIGITETEISVTKIDGTTYEEEKISFDMQAYELEHRVEVLQDDENVDHPEWIEITVYLPLDEYSTEDPGGMFGVSNFWIYSKAEYVDSEGKEALWSYHLTDEMIDEMDDGDVFYTPYYEGEFNDYDAWVLHGLYGFGWIWFQPFTSSYGFQEGSMDVSTPEGSFSYSVEEVLVELSGYSFTGYEVMSSAVTVEDRGELKGTFVPSLSVPVYLRVGDETTAYEMELTHIVLE